MSTRTTVIMFDDIDGSTENVEAVRFSYLGADYEIDLGQENRTRLDDALARFVANARRTGGGRRSSSATRASTDGGSKVDNADVRAWAKKQGVELNSRGRIPKSVIEAYRAGS